LDSFPIDVAFSFLSEDEPLVRRLDDILRQRLTTFVYLDRQREIIGTDGEKTLTRVFEKEARTVCVLYRPKWGTTAFTRFEETAIKNRSHDAGYDFATFIALEGATTRPPWMPRNQVWASGAMTDDALAAILEMRAIDAGASQRLETIEEHVARVNAQADFQQWRSRFLNSEEGVQAAEKEANNFLDTVAREATKIPEFQPERRHRSVIVGAQQFSLVVSWYSITSNSLNDAVMDATVYAGARLDRPPAIASRELRFDAVSREAYAWREGDRHFPTPVLATDLLHFLLSSIEKHIATPAR
jgi:hypothetical protein